MTEKEALELSLAMLERDNLKVGNIYVNYDIQKTLIKLVRKKLKEKDMKAFPNVTNEKGMDLRDYFAAKAMQAYVTGDYDLYPQEIAKKAYQIADWMMEVRKDRD